MSPPDAVARPPYYALLLLAGVLCSLAYWWRVARRDERLLGVFCGALLGAFFGAKIAYLLAQCWDDWPRPDRWLRLAGGKSVLGALLGGYAGVEWAKARWGYSRVTGDRFALMVPLSLMAGRVGCLLQGCCLGVLCQGPHWWTLPDATGRPRWPAPAVELLFNLAAALGLGALRRSRQLVGQHFHLYLMAYGLFRFVHEPWRDTPKTSWGVSGYQALAAAVFALGAWRFLERRAAPASGQPPL